MTRNKVICCANIIEARVRDHVVQHKISRHPGREVIELNSQSTQQQ